MLSNKVQYPLIYKGLIRGTTVTNVSKKAGKTEAHYDVSDKENVKAAVKALHVLLCQEGGAWSAQGVEINYAASGMSIVEAIKNFGEGLALTVVQHLLIRGNLDKVLVFAPKEVLDEWSKTSPAEVKEVGFVAIATMFKDANVAKPEEAARKFPFEGIQYIRPKRREAVAA